MKKTKEAKKKVKKPPKRHYKTNTPKFDYESEDFLNEIEELARKGLADNIICKALVKKYGKTLNPTWFNELKNEKDNITGELTSRASKITEALARGREDIVQSLRSTYLRSALGKIKTKDIVRYYAETKCSCLGRDMECEKCGGTGKIVSRDKAVIQEVEREIPPNMQAGNTLLFNYDPEWRKMIIESKKLDITSGGKEISFGQFLMATNIVEDSEIDEQHQNDTAERSE